MSTAPPAASAGPVDVAVVGGGIVGTASALFLARRGAKVALLEAADLTAGTSGACEGNLLLWDKELERELPFAVRSHELWERLDEEVGGFEFDRKGSTVVAETEDELSALRSRVAALAPVGVRGTVLDRDRLLEEEPALARDLPGGALFPDDAQVEPRLATIAFARAAAREGAAVHLHTPAREILMGADGRATAVITDHGALPAGAVVVACGVWSRQLVLRLGVALPVTPRKGHILVTERGAHRFRRKLSEASYLTAVESEGDALRVAMVVESTAAGTVLIGSSREGAGLNREVDAGVAAVVAERAIRFFPALARARVVRAYAGLRPLSADHLPVVGRLPGHENVCVATGHEGAGISLAPATAELVASLMVDDATPEMATWFSPERFGAALDAAPGRAVA
jgi:glycine/D-amino acid oxidase-like deaminating enzyme